MKFHTSAAKHGISENDAMQTAEWPVWIEPLDDQDDWPHRELRLGFDTSARLLETVVLAFSDGEEMIIHAMPARTQYSRLLGS